MSARRIGGGWLAAALLAPAAGGAGVVPVATPTQLIAAIDGAAPGDVITLVSGIYDISQNLLCDVPGTASAPIVVRSAAPLGALIRFDAVEGFKVSARHWVFEDLDIQGVCADHSDCEHAFHVFGDADFLALRRSRVRDFNAQIKSNRDPLAMVFPDDVVIEGNEFADTAPRQTGNPVTKMRRRRWAALDRTRQLHPRLREGRKRSRLVRSVSQGELARRAVRTQSGDLRARSLGRRPPRPLVGRRRQQSRFDLRRRRLRRRNTSTARCATTSSSTARRTSGSTSTRRKTPGSTTTR